MNRFKSYLISGVLLFAVLPAHAQSSAASLTTSQSGGFWSQQMHKLGAQYFNFATTPTEYANKQDGRLESFNYVGLDYHIDYDRKISLRIPFLANMLTRRICRFSIRFAT